MRFMALVVLVAAAVHAQPGCPPVSFQTDILKNTKPSSTTHLMYVRQSDGSYTAYEMADASPYRVIRVTPNAGSELTKCIFRQPLLPPLAPPQGDGNSPGTSSQFAVFSRLVSGSFLQVQSTDDAAAIDFAVFDSNMTLVSESQYPVSPAFAAQFSLADVNGDGNPDLIALSVTGPTETQVQAQILVFLGKGDGTFQPPTSTLIPGTDSLTHVSTFSIADVDGDGKPDLVVGFNSAGVTTGNNILLLTGNGDGTFGNPKVVSSALEPTSVMLTDLNGDGKADLIFSDLDTNDLPAVSIALGAGDGSFGTPATYALAGRNENPVFSLAVGDVDGDGIPDIISSNGSILFGDGKGSFPRRADYSLTARDGVVPADIDGDGRTDIITGVTGNPLIFIGTDDSGSGTNPHAVTMSLLPNRGDGLFWAAPLSAVPERQIDIGIVGIVAADFNGDGISDLAVTDTDGKLTVLQGSDSGVFSRTGQQYQLTGYPQAMATWDFNGDGKPDLAIAGWLPLSPTLRNLVEIFVGNGKGALEEIPPITLPWGLVVADLATGDFNNDGKQDIAVLVSTKYGGGSSDEVLVYLGNGTGSFESFPSYPVGVGASAITTGDFNGDGQLDLAIASSGTSGLSDGSVTLLLGKGDGTFSVATPISLSVATDFSPYTAGPLNIAAADLNGDGKLDLVVTLSTNAEYSADLAVLLGRGDGTFVAPVFYPATSDGVAITDLNGDGIADLVISGGTDGYLLGNGDGTFAPEVQLPYESGPLVAAEFSRRVSGVSRARGVEPLAMADSHESRMPDLVGGSWLNEFVTLLNTSQPWPHRHRPSPRLGDR